MAWRFRVDLRGGRQHVVEVNTVAELRALRQRAIAHPDVERYTWWHPVDVHGVELPSCPCGMSYSRREGRRRAGVIVCRCGLVHLENWCSACGRKTLDPPPTDGCGPVPHLPGDSTTT